MIISQKKRKFHSQKTPKKTVPGRIIYLFRTHTQIFCTQFHQKQRKNYIKIH